MQDQLTLLLVFFYVMILIERKIIQILGVLDDVVTVI